MFQDMMTNRYGIISERITKHKDNLREELEKQRQKMLEKINENVNEFNQTVLVVRKEMDKMKMDFTDILDLKHDTVLNQIDNDISKVKTIFEEFKNDVNATRSDMIKRYKKKILKIKDISS